VRGRRSEVVSARRSNERSRFGFGGVDTEA
jgi:hypothetical protein